MIKLLYAYPLSDGSNAYELYRAFKNNKDIVTIPLFNISSENNIYVNFGNSILDRIMYKLKLPIDNLKLNKKLLTYDLTKISILFTIKGNTIKPSTLRYIKNKYPNVTIISWSLDDMYAWHNRSIYYTLGLKYYDLVITTKSYNVSELKSIGAKNVLFLYQSFSKYLHKQYKCERSQYNVLFIGYFEKARYESILYLVNNGIKVDVFGPAWGKYVNVHENLIIHNKILAGENYSRALSCAKVSLCFLRKINRDLHTSRSIEIPACKGFMIAERTQEHLDLFEEDKEAVYFDNNEELLKKVQYYLKHENIRKQISENGYKRCLSSGYSYDDKVVDILKEVENL